MPVPRTAQAVRQALMVRGTGVEPALDAVSGRCLCQLGYPRDVLRCCASWPLSLAVKDLVGAVGVEPTLSAV